MVTNSVATHICLYCHHPMLWLANFPVMSQTVDILGFSSYPISFSTTQPCLCRFKAATDQTNKQTKTKTKKPKQPPE